MSDIGTYRHKPVHIYEGHMYININKHRFYGTLSYAAAGVTHQIVAEDEGTNGWNE